MPVSEVQLKKHNLKCPEIHEQFNMSRFEFNIAENIDIKQTTAFGVLKIQRELRHFQFLFKRKYPCCNCVHYKVFFVGFVVFVCLFVLIMSYITSWVAMVLLIYSAFFGLCYFVVLSSLLVCVSVSIIWFTASAVACLVSAWALYGNVTN